MRPCLLLAIFAACLGAAELPYGHPDFTPTSKRPLGFLGDGNSWFPGATPVYEFWEGRPRRVTVEVRDRGGIKPTETWDIDPDPTTAKNILWKQKTHSWANSYPIRVGTKVFTISNPTTLECFDATTGKLLWTFTGNPWLAKGVEAEAAQKCWDLYQVYLACPSLAEGSSTVARGLTGDDWQHVLPILRKTTFPNLIEALAEVDPDHDYQAAADADLAIVEKQIAQWQEAAGKKRFKPRKYGFGKLAGEIRKRIHATSGAGRKATIKLGYSWGYEVGNMTAPVSDGERIYFQTANLGANFCVDLDGNLVWQNHVPSKQRTTCQSPLVVDGVFVSVLGDGTLYGFDSATGERLWEAPTLSPEVAKTAKRGGYYVGSHAVVPLTNDTLAMNVIVTTLCNVIRPRDGKSIGHLPWTYRQVGGGSSIIHGGNVVLRGFCCDGFGGFIEGFALDLVDEDRVVGERVARYPGKATYTNQVATDDFFINGDMRGGIFTPAGAILKSGMRGLGANCNTIAGDLFFWCDPGNRGDLSQWKHRRGDGKAYALFRCADLSDPRAPLPLSDRCLLGGAGFPNMPAMQKYTPALYADPWYSSSTWGKPAHRLHTDNAITAHGDTLYIRTIDALYCIGPAVKGTPADDPQVVASIRAASDAAALTEHLTATSAQYRYEAVKRLGDQKLVDGNAVLTQQLRTIATTDDYQEIRAAALIALGLEPGQPGATMLQELIVGSLSKHGRMQMAPENNAVLLELGQAMEPMLLAMLKDEEQNDRWGNNPLVGAAATVCRRFDVTSDALCDRLIARMQKLEDVRNGDQMTRLAGALGTFQKDPVIIEYFSALPVDDARKPHFEIYAYLFKVAENDEARVALVDTYQHSTFKHAEGQVLAHAIAGSLRHPAVETWLLAQAKAGNEKVITALAHSDVQLHAQRLMRQVVAEGTPLAKTQVATYQLGDRDEATRNAAMDLIEKTIGLLEGDEQIAALNLLAGRANRTPGEFHPRIYPLIIPHLGGPATPAILGALDRFGPKISKPALPRLKALAPEALGGDRRAKGMLEKLLKKLEN